MSERIVSSEQRVAQLSSALKNASELCKPPKLGVVAYSTFSVEAGFSSASGSANTMNDLVRQIGVHVSGLLDSAAAMFADTDSALAVKVLKDL
jgi:hypothetical protein